MATEPAKPGRANEDYAGATTDTFVVVDGAGTPAGSESGCVHGVAWYARQLGAAMLHRATTEEGDLRDALATAIADVADLHRDTCDLHHPGTPSATVTAARMHDSRLEYLALADSSLVIRSDDGVQIITDDRESQIGRWHRQRMDATAAGTREHTRALREYVETMRNHRNQPGGFWVAASEPKAAQESVSGIIDTGAIRDIALLTDGASRLVDRFDLTSWDAALDLIRDHGPNALIRAVREAEATDAGGRRWPRGKTTDDATVIYAKP
ncbi:protein phosphatase 2C domain-containing protein [Isoptericola sp. QY 916]|uniref:protein phosphatase 2C domain-containing protein n=1 Tax=Isoptericola sp. QY 916 TaxID=2782570 RepID=UPI003D2FB29D